jgi:hypothetical protein
VNEPPLAGFRTVWKRLLICLCASLALWDFSGCLTYRNTANAATMGIEGVWVPFPEDDLVFPSDQAFVFTQSEFKIKDTETPEKALVFHYQLRGETLVISGFRAPPGWHKEMTVYASEDFGAWRQSMVKRRGDYLFLQLGPTHPTIRMRRYTQRIPGL